MLETLLSGGVFKFASDVLEKIFPDPQKRAEAQRALLEAETQGKLKEIELQLSAILAEANSKDPWTSRARPTFLYVVYVFILAAIPMGVVYAFMPETAARVAEGVGAWLAAIPEPMWWLFGAGYLGYTAGRSFDKWKLTAR